MGFIGNATAVVSEWTKEQVLQMLQNFLTKIMLKILWLRFLCTQCSYPREFNGTIFNQNPFLAGALPRTLLGSLQHSPRPSSWWGGGWLPPSPKPALGLDLQPFWHISMYYYSDCRIRPRLLYYSHAFFLLHPPTRHRLCRWSSRYCFWWHVFGR